MDNVGQEHEVERIPDERDPLQQATRIPGAGSDRREHRYTVTLRSYMLDARIG